MKVSNVLKTNLLLSTPASFLFGLLTAVAPVAFIHRGFAQLNSHWQVTAFYFLLALLCAVSTLLGFSLSAGEKEIRQQRYFVWGSIVFLFLYIAAAALCEKLNTGTLTGDIWRYLGLLIFTAGAVLRIRAIAQLKTLHSGFVTIQSNHHLVKTGLYSRLRHPSYLAVLVLLVGIPLIFNTWFPLLAIPGAAVALSWRINDEEQLLCEYLGQEYLDYQRQTWRLIPFIY